MTRSQVEKPVQSAAGLFALLMLAAQPAVAQGDPMHCDSMVRAAMLGYGIRKDSPCIDVSQGDWPKSAMYYSRFEYFCIGRERNPACN